ncbi:gamma-glutamyltransferase [bacterium]|nr:gamma-glutamyltransferase [bacterium]
MKSILLFLSTFFFIFQASAIPAEGHKIMIAAPTQQVISIGPKIMQKGGNVVDVAVAVELALAVTSPYNASLGGGGFAMVRMNQEEPVALDFRETAPILTHPNFYKERGEKASTIGSLAVGIPGIALGLWDLHQKYGKLKWAQLFDDAIRLAEQGFAVSGDWVRDTEETKNNFNSSGKKYFFKNEQSYKPGELLRQPQLGKALRKLRDEGPKAFYSGDVAKDIIATLKKNGGVMAIQDLQNYKTRWLTPLKKDFLGHTVYMMPPPSSSGVLTSTIIGLAEQTELAKKAPTSVEEAHQLAEIFKMAFRGRSLLGDPDYNKNPVTELTSTKYIKTLAGQMSSRKPVKLSALSDETLKKESSETTNFTVMDAAGNTVVMTITLNGTYGSAMVSEKYGVALNNQMDDFTTIPDKPNMYGLIQGKANVVQAGKRPLSSMSPTIITKNNKTVLGVGGAGGPRIITGVFQSWYRAIANGYNMDRAIQTPRLHHQFLPEQIFIDDTQFSVDTQRALEKMGHKTEVSWTAKINGIRLREDGILEGAYDSRSEGGAGGL